MSTPSLTRRYPGRILVLAAAVALGGCDDADPPAFEVPPPDPPERMQPGAVAPAAGPAETLRAFVSALRGGLAAEAAGFISRDTLDVERGALIETLDRWSDDIATAQRELTILDVRRSGDIALAIARLRFPENMAPLSDQAFRPVVLVRENDRWKIVWGLIGKPSADTEDVLPDDLASLYRWYDQRLAEYRHGVGNPAG